MRSALWSCMMVSKPARPGATIFGPPLNPAKKCGSTKPVVMRTSASIHALSSHTGMPLDDSPTYSSVSESNALWFTTL